MVEEEGEEAGLKGLLRFKAATMHLSAAAAAAAVAARAQQFKKKISAAWPSASISLDRK